MNFKQDYRSGSAALLDNADIIARIQAKDSSLDPQTLSIAASVADYAVNDAARHLATMARIMQEWQAENKDSLIGDRQALQAFAYFAETAGESIMQAVQLSAAISVLEVLQRGQA